MKIINVKTLPQYLGHRSSDQLLPCEILIEQGKIVEFDTKVSESQHIVDGRGCLLAPGLIDPQVHLREPGQEHKEDIESGSRAAAKGGFTTIICMPNTQPTVDNPETLKYIIERSNEIGLCRVLPTASVTKNLAGDELVDFTALKAAGAIAFTDDGRGIQSDELMFKAMSEIAKLDMPLLDHSEDISLSKGGAIHLGQISQKFNVPGIDARSESVHVKRGCEFALKTGCHFHVLHVSTEESLKYIKEAKELGAPVSAEVSPHHLLLCDEDIPVINGELDPNFKMNPPLRGRKDLEACQQALFSGLIDMIATDHAPHSFQEKNSGIKDAPFGVIGLETSFPLLFTHFVKSHKIKLNKLVEMMTVAPAKLFHLDAGHLNVGRRADIVLIDLEASRVIQAQDFLSKSQNSPFIGQRIFGLPRFTMLSGKTTYNNLE